MSKQLTSTLLSLTLLLVQSSAARAQPATGGPTPTVLPPTPVPLDGGASLLLASGLAYGLRRLKQRRQK